MSVAVPVVALLLPALADAESLGRGAAKLTPPPIGALMNFGPLVAPPGQEREIVISGVWPDGCAPQDAVITDNGLNPLQTVVVTLGVPLTLQACIQVPTGYTVRTRYTPTSVGAKKVLATTNTGRYVAESYLVTSELTNQRALFDVSGLWYNPEAPGWGLSFTHNFAGTGAAFGTWYVYRQDGSPKWYTLQNITWNVYNNAAADPPVVQTMVATVYETEGADCPVNVAPQLIEACLVKAKTVRDVGRMTITFLSQFTAAITIERPPALLFQSLGRIQKMSF